MAGVTQTSSGFGDDYEARVTADGTEPLSTRVVEAVAMAEGVEVTALDEDLYEGIDGDDLPARRLERRHRRRRLSLSRRTASRR